VLHRLLRSTFVRPRERLYELLALQEADSRDGLLVNGSSEALLDQRTLAGYVADLRARGLVERVSEPVDSEGGTRLRLTPAGRDRLHYLTVDVVREFAALHESAQDLMRGRLVPLAMEGVRRVAFYPFGETAEVAYSVLEALELELVAIVDDSPEKWNLRFHGLLVQPPSALREAPVEAVIVTTAVFRDRILERLRAMDLGSVRLHTF
jgi:hypothetical protein